MIYSLVLILAMGPTNLQGNTVGAFQTMDECFKAREMLVEKIGRPIINYQAVCVVIGNPDEYEYEPQMDSKKKGKVIF